MDSPKITLRPFAPRDYPAEHDIDVEFEARMSISVEELQRDDEVRARQPDHLNLKLVAETSDDSRMVGYGSLTQPNHNFHPQKYWIWVLVRKAFYGRGVGAALYSALEMEARVRQATTLWTNVHEEGDRGRSFAERRGFVPERKVWLSTLDLASADVREPDGLGAKLAADGIRISTWAAEGAKDERVRRRIYELSQTCSRDVPRIGKFHPATFEHYQATELDNTMVIPEGLFLAIAGENYIGLSSLERDTVIPDTLRIGFTGVLPAYRGRGIAYELKRRAVEFARNAGYRRLQTGNDSLNQPILAINQRMGFRPEVAWMMCAKKLDGRA